MPSHGLAGTAMQAAVFKSGPEETGGSALARALNSGMESFLSERSAVSAFAATAPADLTESIGGDDFEVISQRFDDGPAQVRMTQAARLALEASNPDIRVFPITRYYLPGRNPRRSSTVAAGSNLSAVNAADAGGAVFTDDAKQHFLTGDPAGNAGKGVIVGVLDTGIDASHPALAGSLAASRCFIPGVAPTAGGPVNWGAANRALAGHGTHVAGIIAARDGFGGPAGVAPEAKLISYRIFPDDPSRVKGAENPVIIDSIRAAIEDGCHVINLSIEGATLKEDGVRSAIADAWAQGVLCVSVAGNGYGKTVSYPGALPHCIAVTAIGREGAYPARPEFQRHVTDQRASSDPDVFLASFSNFGPQVQFTAPGHAIVSTFPGNGWWFDSGTSMAAPFITGMVARLLSNNSDVLDMIGDATRSAAMLQMLVGQAHVLGLPQTSQEGYGLPA